MKSRKLLSRAGVLVAALVVADLAAMGVLRSRPVKRALTARLGAAFGRQVEVERFGLSLLPTPRLEAEGVTVGEDPAFGYEYFLRAERVTAGLRWSGLLGGRIEFGAFSFTRPSLTLVRDSAGGWNLDHWLPPARTLAGEAPSTHGAAPAVRLDLVEFDEGRVNFMSGADKLAFAFAEVSGKVAQVAPGRWTLRLKAQPWRSGTPLQEAGTILVRGDIAGTSARLQPAEIFIHWGEASLADLLRLVRGQDYGLRGEVSVDAVARSGGTPGAAPAAASGEWGFRIAARARQIHRWDLPERRDNPAVNVLLEGRWNIASSQVQVAPLEVEFPQSSARGKASFSLRGPPAFELRVDSMGIQAADLLASYRAFQTEVAEGVSAAGYLTGAAALRGWPLALENVAFSSNGLTLRVPQVAQALRVGPFEGGRARNRLALDPLSVSFGEDKEEPRPGSKSAPIRPAPRSGARERPANDVQIAATHDLERGTGAFTAEGRLERAEDFLALAAALGRPLERGWTGKGSAAGSLRWDWQGGPWNSRLTGHLDFSRGELQVAGLNLPLAVQDAQLVWSAGKRSVRLGSVEAFGADWSGELEEDSRLFAGTGRAGILAGAGSQTGDQSGGWRFRLHADRLKAADLDLWTGPRARPGWLERLLPGLLGKAARPGEAGVSAGATELLRRIRAEGEIRVEEFTIEKQKLTAVKARAALVDLRLVVWDATADYAGGRVRGGTQTAFLPRPRYSFDLQLDGVRLGELLASGKPGRVVQDRPEGIVSGPIHLETDGVGREELLRNLKGRGRVRLRDVVLRGWDSAAGDLPAADRVLLSTRWPAGEGVFSLGKGAIEIEELWLRSGREKIGMSGRVDFSRSANLSLGVPLPMGPGLRKRLRIEGPLDAPKLSAYPRSE